MSKKTRGSLGVLALSLLAGCGAKTGLLVPDSTTVGDAGDDVFVRFESCVAGRFRMERRAARMVFVIDRSGSMASNLVTGEPLDRWTALYRSLSQTIPRFEASMQMGALIFPRVPTSQALAGVQACDQLPGDGLDVTPALRNGSTLLRAIALYPPLGATPTAAAISRAARYVASREVRGLAQYLVLATDGGPNCNPTLNPATCACPVAGGCAATGLGSRYCLDDAATVTAIDNARRSGVSTYVIGIDGDLDATYVDVLDRMAVAGGRALSGPRRYFSVREGAQLDAAFEEIQRTVVRCAYVTPSRPDAPDRIEVRAAGGLILRDESRRNGWDWTDRSYGELTLFGAACERVAASMSTLEATVACGP